MRRNTVPYINAYVKHVHQEKIKCETLDDKGRVLTANQSFSHGEVIIEEPLLQKVSVDPSNLTYQKLHRICIDLKFKLSPIWYWCALNSLFLKEDFENDEKEVYDEEVKSRIKSTKLQLKENLNLSFIEKEKQEKLMSLFFPESIKPCTEVLELLKEFGLNGIVNPLKLELLLQIWIYNCFEYTDNPVAYILFYLPSFLSHSCLPNTVWHVDEEKEVFILKARCNIFAGDELTLSYLSEDDLFLTAASRRKILYDTKGFLCKCPRCTSSADLARGFRCPKCTVGNIYLNANVQLSEEAEEDKNAHELLNVATTSINTSFSLVSSFLLSLQQFFPTEEERAVKCYLCHKSTPLRKNDMITEERKYKKADIFLVKSNNDLLYDNICYKSWVDECNYLHNEKKEYVNGFCCERCEIKRVILCDHKSNSNEDLENLKLKVKSIEEAEGFNSENLAKVKKEKSQDFSDIPLTLWIYITYCYMNNIPFLGSSSFSSSFSSSSSTFSTFSSSFSSTSSSLSSSSSTFSTSSSSSTFSSSSSSCFSSSFCRSLGFSNAFPASLGFPNITTQCTPSVYFSSIEDSSSSHEDSSEDAGNYTSLSSVVKYCFGVTHGCTCALNLNMILEALNYVVSDTCDFCFYRVTEDDKVRMLLYEKHVFEILTTQNNNNKESNSDESEIQVLEKDDLESSVDTVKEDTEGKGEGEEEEEDCLFDEINCRSFDLKRKSACGAEKQKHKYKLSRKNHEECGVPVQNREQIMFNNVDEDFFDFSVVNKNLTRRNTNHVCLCEEKEKQDKCCFFSQEKHNSAHKKVKYAFSPCRKNTITHTFPFLDNNFKLLKYFKQRNIQQLTEEERNFFEHFLFTVFTKHWLLFCWINNQIRWNKRKKKIAQTIDKLEIKLRLIRDMYPAASGSLAWCLEELGDSLVLLHKQLDNSRKLTHDDAIKLICDRRVMKRLHTAIEAYKESYVVLSFLFGKDHKYNSDVKDKIACLESLLQSALEDKTFQTPSDSKTGHYVGKNHPRIRLLL